MLGPRVDPCAGGVNIDGVCLFDPFSAGNVQEIIRLCGMASVPVGTIFCQDRVDRVCHASAYTIGTNGDFLSGTGEYLGGLLGFDEVRATFSKIVDKIDGSNSDPVLEELETQEERVVRACDKYLHRYDPPVCSDFRRAFLCGFCCPDTRTIS